MEACVRLQASAPEDAEFYVVVQGSTLTHVTAAKRGDDGLSLCFIVPGMFTSWFFFFRLSPSRCFPSWLPPSPTGHSLAEVATVTSFFCAEDQIKPCSHDASIKYLRDVAQEAAEYLCANREQLGPQSYREVLKRFSTRAADMEPSASVTACGEEVTQLGQSQAAEAALRQLDENITCAMANMDYPPQWNNSDSQPGEEGNETGSESKTVSFCFTSCLTGKPYRSDISDSVLLNTENYITISRVESVLKWKSVFKEILW